MIKYGPGYLVLISCLVLGSCAPSRFVRPLKENEKALSFNTGGPLINFAGTTIPMPMSALTFGKALNDKQTGFASLHTTALLFGTFQAEIGYLKEFYTADSLSKYIPSLSFTTVANFAIDKWEWKGKFWPELDVNAYWNYGKKGNFVYCGCAAWYESASTKAFDEKQQYHYIFNPQLGHTFCSASWNYTIEMKYLAPNISNQDLVVDYAKMFGKKGAVGIYLSVTKRFGGRK